MKKLRLIPFLMIFTIVLLSGCGKDDEVTLGIVGKGDNITVNEPENMKLVYNEDILGEELNQLPVKSDDLFGAHRFVMDNDGSIEKYKLTFVNLVDGKWIEDSTILEKELVKGENEFIIEDMVNSKKEAYISIENEVFGPVNFTNVYEKSDSNTDTVDTFFTNTCDMKKGETSVVACWIPNDEGSLEKSIEVFGSAKFTSELDILYDNPEKTAEVFERCSMICITFE